VSGECSPWKYDDCEISKLISSFCGANVTDDLAMFLVSSAKDGDYVFISVCPSVCPLCYSRSYKHILMKSLQG